jgi:hypothetical protein
VAGSCKELRRVNGNWLAKPDHFHRYAGLRPEIQELIDRVDLEDPALTFIATALAEMRDAGIEITKDVMDQAVKLGRARWAKEPARTGPPEVPKLSGRRIKDGIVYYIQRGPLVKIGTTIDPHGRFAALLPDAIHAYEPGSRPVEAARHKQFRHLRTGSGEHFIPDDELREHMRQLRKEHGDPDPTWPTTANVADRRPGVHRIPVARDPELVTLTEGADRTGMKRNTVQVWAWRGKVTPVGENAKGRKLFFLDDLRYLADYYNAVGEARTIRRL